MSDYSEDEQSVINSSDDDQEYDDEEEDDEDEDLEQLTNNMDEVFGENTALVDGSDDESDEEEIYNSPQFKNKDEYILDSHPELIPVNFQELKSCSNVIYNEKGHIDDPLHKSAPILTKYEFTRLVGMRAKQINDGAKPFIEVDHSIIDGYTIALAEIKQKKFPCYIRRPKPNGKTEYWKLSDLEIIHY
jgi:DNA-directed RNA polymerase subunit K/omega